MPKWTSWGRMTHGEYRANLNGLGIFFGAVLGFVMAGTETLEPIDFALTLFLAATVVITILYVSSSPRRIAYALVSAILIAGLPRILGELLSEGAQIPRNLQPTLAVWLGITLIVEFLPREKHPAEPPASDPD
jgi:hypothetical protein